MNPWSNFPLPLCYPDHCQCEGVVDALIRQPSSFYSSFAYLFVTLAFFLFIKNKNMDLKLWAALCALIGLTSLFAHGSFTQLGMATDFSSIVFFLTFFTLLNLFKKFTKSVVVTVLGLSFVYGLLVILLYSLSKELLIGLGVLSFLIFVRETIKEKGLHLHREANFLKALFILGLSFLSFLLDEFHVLCNPQSLLQWHSLWHIGSSIALYQYGQWRFKKPSDF